MNEQFVTIAGFDHCLGKVPFKIGKKRKCRKEPHNFHDSEAIGVYTSRWGTVGYIANSTWTVATGTKSAGGIAHMVRKKFKVEVMFMTQSKIICKVLDGLREEKSDEE